MKKKVVWLDERTRSYTSAVGSFVDELRSDGIDVIVCGEGNSDGNIRRAEFCVSGFRTCLEAIIENDEIDRVAGFILDLNIPVPNLSEFGTNMRGIGTGEGAYTGIQIARYILANEDELSPYGDLFKHVPVLYLSISDYGSGEATAWMGREYKKFSVDARITKYAHVEKSLGGSSTTVAVKAWASKIMSVKSNESI